MPLYEVRYRIEGTLELEADDLEKIHTFAPDIVAEHVHNFGVNPEICEVIEIED